MPDDFYATTTLPTLSLYNSMNDTQGYYKPTCSDPSHRAIISPHAQIHHGPSVITLNHFHNELMSFQYSIPPFGSIPVERSLIHNGLLDLFLNAVQDKIKMWLVKEGPWSLLLFFLLTSFGPLSAEHSSELLVGNI